MSNYIEFINQQEKTKLIFSNELKRFVMEEYSFESEQYKNFVKFRGLCLESENLEKDLLDKKENELKELSKNLKLDIIFSN